MPRGKTTHDNQVNSEILSALHVLNANTSQLATAIEKLETAVQLRIQVAEVAAAPEPSTEEERWAEKAARFVQSQEAAKLAVQHALTTDRIAAITGIAEGALKRGHRSYIGKLLSEAGYARVSNQGRADYRKLQNGTA